MKTKGRSPMQGGSLLIFSVPMLIFRGLLRAFLLSLIFLLLSTAALYFSPLSEAFVPYFVFGAIILSILSGSIYVGKSTDEKGWLRGGITGLFYVLVLLILSNIFQESFIPGFNIITKFFLGFCFGTLGGIIGINS